MAKAKKQKLPTFVYVQRGSDGCGPDWFQADELPEDAVDAPLGDNPAGEYVGIYELKRMVRMTRRLLRITPIKE